MPDYSKPAEAGDIHDCRNAMFSEAFPCNPRPFINALGEIVREGEGIQSDDAKRVLWVINSMAFGQMALTDQCVEWDRLHKLYNTEQTTA